jgi:transcriptional antiterminator RfaH
MNWYALYTKPKWEKKVAKQLEDLEINVFCPMITEVKQWSDRKKKVTSPLFKSYVFVQLPEKERSKVFDIPGVVQYLFWLGKPAIVRDAEIATLKEWLADERVENMEVSHLSPGDKMIIANGSFKGKEGIVQKVGAKRLKLVLKDLGLVVNVKVSDVLEN